MRQTDGLATAVSVHVGLLAIKENTTATVFPDTDHHTLTDLPLKGYDPLLSVRI